MTQTRGASPTDWRLSRILPRHGLHTVLEFFPWTVVPNFGAALTVVEATGQPGIGILVDTLHFNRSNSSVAQLAHSPKERLLFVHVADAPVQEAYTTDELLKTACGATAARGRRDRHSRYPRSDA